MSKKSCLKNTVSAILMNYENEELLLNKQCKDMPDREAIIQFIKDLQPIMFLGYLGNDSMIKVNPEYYIGTELNKLYDLLRKEITISLLYFCKTGNKEKCDEKAKNLVEQFFMELKNVQSYLMTDVQAAFDGDPAAKTKEDIVFSYPGMFAIYVYRIAHVLYDLDVPFIPRIMSEYAHGRTGIDINPGACIGKYFFIDHGTGVVIGETTIIGDHVKIYQGVTLGALSTRNGQQLRDVKRHPTIGNNVTVYSNSTILGGDTLIGSNSVIAGNTFITSSIKENTKVGSKNPELIIREDNN